MSCASPILKFTLFVLNILCCVSAILVLSACTYALIEFDAIEAIKTPCILGIVLSSVLLLNSILGWYGILRKSIRFTWIYAIIMMLLLMGQIAVIFLEPANYDNIANEMIDDMWKSDLESEYMMTMFEMKHKCCGKFGPSDYTEAGWQIPLSCYSNNNKTIENQFVFGCVKRLSDMYSHNKEIEELSDWTIVVLEGTSAFVAAILVITLKNMQRRKLYH